VNVFSDINKYVGYPTYITQYKNTTQYKEK
jgi:hypothetical protein